MKWHIVWKYNCLRYDREGKDGPLKIFVGEEGESEIETLKRLLDTHYPINKIEERVDGIEGSVYLYPLFSFFVEGYEDYCEGSSKKWHDLIDPLLEQARSNSDAREKERLDKEKKQMMERYEKAEREHYERLKKKYEG